MRKEKIYNLIIYILTFLLILSTILIKELNDLDEIWNYNFARNFANGLIPYKDFNMVITPLLSMVCGIILKITFNELIVMRILAAILCSSILFITYKLFNLLNVKKQVSLIFTFLIGCLFNKLFCIDYNFASLFLVLIIIYKEISGYKQNNNFIKANKKIDIVLGILAGLAITIKQTSGFLILVALLGNRLIFVRKKEEFREYLKIFIYRLIGVIMPISLLIIYLIVNGAFFDFISYTINGVSEFSNVIPYTNLIKFNFVGVLSILVPIAFIYEWIKCIILEKNKNTYILLVYGLAIFVLCFPISDKIHFLIGALPTIILILYETYNLIKKIILKILPIKDIKFILLTMNYIIILTVIYFSIINIYNYILQQENYSKVNHFKYIPISSSLEEQIKKVDNYIVESNKKVLILDSSAATYMIPIDRYNKDYDMFNKGNFGADGENRLIKEIETLENTQYLILKDSFAKNWQTPLKIIDYIKENKTKVGTIEIFNVYE